MTDAELRAVEEVIALLRDGVPLHDVAAGLDPSLVEFAALLAGDLAEASWGAAPAVPAGFDAVMAGVAALGGVGASGAAAAASGGSAAGGGGSAAGATGGGGGAAGGGTAAGGTAAGGAAATGTGVAGAGGAAGGVAGFLGGLGATTSTLIVTAAVASAVTAGVLLTGDDDAPPPAPEAIVEGPGDASDAEDPDLSGSLWGESPGEGQDEGPNGDAPDDPDPPPSGPPDDGEDPGTAPPGEEPSDDVGDPPLIAGPSETPPVPPVPSESITDPPAASTDPPGGPTDPPGDPTDPDPDPGPDPPPPSPPVASPVRATAISAEPGLIDVLAEATGPEVPLDPSTLRIATAPSFGRATVTDDHRIAYTPSRFWPGEDRLSYEVCDEAAACARAVVTIASAMPIERREVAVATNAPWIDLDFLPEGLPRSAFVHLDDGRLSPPASAAAPWRWQLVDSGRADLPLPDLPLRAVVQVPAADGTRTEVRIVLQDRGSPYRPPVARDIETTAVSAEEAVIDVLADASGPEVPLDATTLRIVTRPDSGEAEVTDDARIAYTPSRFWSGGDRFAYEVCDEIGACATGTVSVASARPIEEVEVAIASNAAFHDLDLEGYEIATADDIYVEHGRIERPDGRLRWLLTPVSDLELPVRAVLLIDRSGGGTVELRVTLVDRGTPLPPPVVPDLEASALSAQPTLVDVLAEAQGPEVPLDPTTLEVVAGPADGVARVTSSQQIEYIPDRFWPGEDELVYEVCDEGGVCGEGSVSISSERVIEVVESTISDHATFWDFNFAAHRDESTADFVYVESGRTPQRLGWGWGWGWRWYLTPPYPVTLPVTMVVNIDALDGTPSELRVTLVGSGAVS